MIKLNKKGFSLVELLVVIAILAVIMTIAIPSITSSLERQKEKERNTKIELIKSSAEIFYDEHGNLSSTLNSITVEKLVEKGYLTKAEASDPTSSDSLIIGCLINTISDGIKFYDATDDYNYNECLSKVVE